MACKKKASALTLSETTVNESQVNQVSSELNKVHKLAIGLETSCPDLDALAARVDQNAADISDLKEDLSKITSNPNLADGAITTANKGYNTNSDAIATLNNYSLIEFDVIGGMSVTITGLNENLTTYGYYVKDANNTTVASGSESDDMSVKIPSTGIKMGVTIKTANLATLVITAYGGESYEAIEEIQSKTTVFFPQTATVGYYLTSTGALSSKTGNYAYSDYISVIPNTKYMLTGYITAATSTIHHCFYNANKEFISATLANTRYITTPPNCHYVRLSLLSNNLTSFDIAFFERKKNVVVFGDSWSDNDSTYTTYTKWTTLLDGSNDYATKVYAQNGSTITGDTPNYAENGNVQGQVDQFVTDAIPIVDVVVFFGGINDFRGGISANAVISKLTDFVTTVKTLYPDVDIVYIANHQLFITQEQLDYMHQIVKAVRGIGVRGYVTFGWIPPTNFIPDMVHPDNVGYQYIFANVEAILKGGDVYYVRNSVLIDPTSESDGVSGHIVETWTDGYPSFSSDLLLYTGGLNKTFEWNITTAQKMLLSSLPFSKTYNKVGNRSANGACVLENTTPTSFGGNYKMNSNSSFRLVTDASDRTGQWYTNDYN